MTGEMNWARTVKGIPLPQGDEPKESFLPRLMATDWMQYLALTTTLGRREATVQSRFFLALSNRRLLIYQLAHIVYEVPLRFVLEVKVVPPPGREGRAWELMRKLYRVETVKVLHETEYPTIKAMFYDAGIDTEPFAERLLKHVEKINAGPASGEHH